MVARRTVLSLVATLMLAAACARTAPGSAEVGSNPGPSPVDQRTIDIYTNAIRALVETENWFDPVLIDDRICEGAGDVMGEGNNRCTPFTEAEKDALLVELADIPHVRFVDDAHAVTQQIFKGEIEGAGLIAVGPITGSGDRVEVPGEAYCGGLCGHWMTLVIERDAAGWSVSGTTGPIAIS